MLKLIVLFCLLIKTHSWTWKDYPSPRGPNYSKCRVSRPGNVCDPDGMLTDQQREEIVQMTEDFKEKTKRTNSKFLSMRGGLELFVALAKDKIGDDDSPSGITHLCYYDKWKSMGEPKCGSAVQGIELNTDGFRYCYSTHWLMILNRDEYVGLNKAEEHNYENGNYFEALKSYIENLLMLYDHRFSIFDKNDHSNKDETTLSQVQQISQYTEKILSKVNQSLDGVIEKINKFGAAIDKNNMELLEMRELISKTLIQIEKSRNKKEL
ncbi:unnamed protein product [Meloidogyne enterolobii]|uniref:Uncharacterized protein n=1 Tax=Meloidogyne enterolobii TaxID=390850 RepID=A0ACB1AVR7_MELEN